MSDEILIRRHQFLDFLIAQRDDLSFSWYCRRPAEASVGAAVRTGDAIFGLVTVDSTRPACEGTAAATLLNMIVWMCEGVPGI
jgi:hypothetical protein